MYFVSRCSRTILSCHLECFTVLLETFVSLINPCFGHSILEKSLFQHLHYFTALTSSAKYGKFMTITGLSRTLLSEWLEFATPKWCKFYGVLRDLMFLYKMTALSWKEPSIILWRRLSLWTISLSEMVLRN